MRERERVPGEEKRFVQAVDDIDDEVVVRHGVNVRPRELAVNEYALPETRSCNVSSDRFKNQSSRTDPRVFLLCAVFVCLMFYRDGRLYSVPSGGLRGGRCHHR